MSRLFIQNHYLSSIHHRMIEWLDHSAISVFVITQGHLCAPATSMSGPSRLRKMDTNGSSFRNRSEVSHELNSTRTIHFLPWDWKMTRTGDHSSIVMLLHLNYSSSFLVLWLNSRDWRPHHRGSVLDLEDLRVWDERGGPVFRDQGKKLILPMGLWNAHCVKKLLPGLE